jgi:hypothetical protein
VIRDAPPQEANQYGSIDRERDHTEHEHHHRRIDHRPSRLERRCVVGRVKLFNAFGLNAEATDQLCKCFILDGTT